MSLFGKKSSQILIGIYALYDPAVKDKNCKFSPPFFSPADDIACQALCETLRRHNTSFERLLKSEFLRMELWRLGSFDSSKGSLISTHKHKYLVCKLREFFSRDYVRKYMSDVSYPTEEEIRKES